MSGVTTIGYVYDGSQQLLPLNLTAGSPNQGRVIQNNFLGTQPGEILAVDIPGQTGTQPTPTVWLYSDLSGSVASLGSMNSSGAWQIQQRQFSGTGLVQSISGDSFAAFAQVPVIWNGAHQQTQPNSPVLYDLNGRRYDPAQNRFLSDEGISANSPNPYTLNGNNPVNSAGSDLSQYDGPDGYSDWFRRGAGESDRQVFGDSYLISNSWSAELAVTGGIIVSSVVAVLAAPVTVPSLLLTGAAIGVVDYAGTWAIGATIDTFDNGFGNYQINRFSPALAAQYAASGALTAGAFTLGGAVLRPLAAQLGRVGRSSMGWVRSFELDPQAVVRVRTVAICRPVVRQVPPKLSLLV